MQTRPDLQIKSILKAMTDVVLPAVDPDNKLAQEQARLCMGLLGLMARQLPLQFRFDCDELARLSAYSAELQRIAGDGGAQTRAAITSLEKTAAEASALLERAKAAPVEIEMAVRSMREATGSVISSVFRDGDAAAQDRVQKATLAMSKEQLLRERAWVITQGWEPDPKSVPPIEELLG
ncbi:MAG: hypothetical protein K0Q76_448 [Panacagrimonas sp.]|jgi:hypothetical protein|nr:hypothetical protein [Panacagrimonas sp.]MCC2655340.1 hypothetical protein [Panacagrimonas sp.]